jgi:N-methylhydantoinase A
VPATYRTDTYRTDTYRIGIDVGGTFTDVVLVNDQSGAVHVAKLLNSHAERADTVVAAITRLLEEAGITSRDVAYISHGTTITTNAVIERKGARTALVTNDGFRDILEIGRFARPPELIYRAHADRPAPYVPRSLRLGIRGRIAADGSEVTALDKSDLHALTERLRAAKVEAVAVCLLFSFLRPEHETAVRDHLAASLPGVEIVTSSDILREFREYPRTSTTVFAAYVAPVLRRYVSGLVERLAGRGITSPVYIFQSNGGVARPEVLMRNPALTLLSGPAGAVVGAVQLCGPAGFSNLITMDIGGTSLDVCVVRNGRYDVTKSREIEMQPVALPMLNVHTVGAGGGSVVRVDDVGRVSVGPDSVAANPGPACYGRGGTEATLTDVNVTLGLIEPIGFADGALALDPIAAASVLAKVVGAPLGLDAVHAAAGVYRVATNQMAEAIRKATIEGGHDPRDFTLVAFGGGGPLHACAVAREVGIGTVLVPMHPGLFSARGIALSDFYHDYVQSMVRPLSALDWTELDDAFARLDRQANDDLSAEGIPADRRQILHSLDIRYLGQSSEINVMLDDGANAEAVTAGFHALHEALYSYKVEGEPLELVNLRVRAVGAVPKAKLRVPEHAGGAGRAMGRRQVHLPAEDEACEMPVYRRSDLGLGARIEGPALVEEASSTTFLVSRSHCVVDAFHNLVIEVEA